MWKLLGSGLNTLLGSMGSLASGVFSSALNLILPLMLILGLGTTLGKTFGIPMDKIKGFIKDVAVNGFNEIKDIGKELWNSFGFGSSDKDKNKSKENHKKAITKSPDGTLKA